MYVGMHIPDSDLFAGFGFVLLGFMLYNRTVDSRLFFRELFIVGDAFGNGARNLGMIKLRKRVMLLFLIASATHIAEAREASSLLVWPESGLPAGVVPHDAVLTREDVGEAGPLLGVEFQAGQWPNVWFIPTIAETWDWQPYVGLGFRIRNESTEPVLAAIRVDNEGADGVDHCLNHRVVLSPTGVSAVEAYFPTVATDALWGMRGLPLDRPLFSGKRLDMEAITACQIFLPGNSRERRLLIESVYLITPQESNSSTREIRFPFVDKFGQFLHATWPGKLASADALQERDDKEASNPMVPDTELDRFGGWLKGPQLDATGWFRTEKYRDKWWLVTPEGHLFLSIGVNCVGTWEQTFTEQREHWFEWLPERDDPLFGPLLGRWEGAHSGSEIIAGSGQVFSFYRANLARTFGEDWPDRWRARTLRRLQGWGFNTLGNWSQSDVTGEHRLPYVTSAVIAEVPVIKEAAGHWSSMMDVFDDAFLPAVERAVANITDKHRSNPLCIGYFFDNELAWEGVIKGVLRSNDSQPARRAMVSHLQQLYPRLDNLNAEWQTAYTAWEEIGEPEIKTAACRQALDGFLYRFAERYFTAIRDSLDRHAPNQMYLGCRFASAPDPVVRACSASAHVISFNQYVPHIDCAEWQERHSMDVPMLVGEFHFGALDRGMFHGGLVPVSSQQERAESYRKYWEALATCPSFVGAHWFQYVDEPITGRSYDGENYNIGLVDVTDTPYPELVSAARKLHERVYRLRLEGRAE